MPIAQKLLFHHRLSSLSPNSLAFTMVALQHQIYIVLAHHSLQQPLLLSATAQHSLHLLPHHCPLRQHSARRQQPYNPRLKKTRWKLLEPALGSWIYFMKLDLRPNSFPKSILQPLWNNTSIALPTAWVLEAYACTFKYGIIGLANANTTLFLQPKPLYPLSSIIYMPPITSNARKIPNLPEPG